MDASFIAENFASEFGYRDGGNKVLKNLVGRLSHEHKGEYVNAGFAQALAHESTIGAFRRRAARGDLTGEWIVFTKKRGDRFYLCLATHDETNEAILDRAKAAKNMDFKFL